MFEPSTTTCWGFAVLVVIRRVIVESSAVINAVFFDFGGVILASPFEAFNRYETANGLPQDFLRRVNTAEPHANAWARLERSEIDSEAFDAAFADESERLGHRVRGSDSAVLRRIWGVSGVSSLSIGPAPAEAAAVGDL